MSSKKVIVSIMLSKENIRVGKLWFHFRGARESASFEYDKKWLEHPEKFALNFDDTSASLENAMAVTREFRLSKDKANQIIKEVNMAVKQWRKIAIEVGLSKLECDRMASAFEYEE